MWDVFICHASEDKDQVARPLAIILKQRGLSVFYDEYSLTLGDSLRRKIEEGLAKSRFGVVILSRKFFAKEWPQRELDGLVAREINGSKVILPIWHDVDQTYVTRFSPPLADKLAVSTSKGLNEVVNQILQAVNLLIDPTEPAATSGLDETIQHIPSNPPTKSNSRVASTSAPSEQANHRRIWLSGMLHAFVEQHRGVYSHNEWLSLLEQIKGRGFTPYNSNGVGALLERAKDQWRISHNRYGTELYRAIDWIFPAYYISQVLPVIHGSDVFWAAADYHVYRINLADGSSIWETKLDGEVRNCALCYVPTTKRVLAATQRGTLFSLSNTSGEVKWASRAIRKFDGFCSFDKIMANDKIVVASETYTTKKLFVFDAKTGELIFDVGNLQELRSRCISYPGQEVASLIESFAIIPERYQCDTGRYKVNIDGKSWQRNYTLKIIRKSDLQVKTYDLKSLHAKLAPGDAHCGLSEGGCIVVGESLLFTSGRLLIKLELDQVFWT